MNELRSTLTDLGKREIKEAIANETTVRWRKIAVGDGGGDEIIPSTNMIQLVNQTWVGNLSSRDIDPQDPQRVIFHATIPNQITGFTIREVGILNENDELMAVSRSNVIDKEMGQASGGYIDVDLYFSVIVQDARCIEIIPEQNVETATRADLNALGDRVLQSEGDIVVIYNSINNIENNLEGVHNTLNDHAADLKTIQQLIADIQSSVAGIQQFNTDLERRVKALETTLDGVDKLLEIV